MAEAANKAPTKWDTHVQIVMGPPDNYVFKSGETARFKIALLPLNKCPTAITQIFFYVGQPGKPKQIFKMFNGCPGHNPQVSFHDFEYKIPAWEKKDRHHGMLLELGWGQEMQYNWADAMKHFHAKGYKEHWLYTVPVAPPAEIKHQPDFLLDLCTPLPKRAVAGETISLDFSYRTQSHGPNAISQALIYFRDEAGDCDTSKLMDHVPGKNPPMKRGGMTYRIPKCAAGQELEVGAFFDLQFTFKDALANFKKNGSKRGAGQFLVLGKIQVIAPDSKDAEKTRTANVFRHAANFSPGMKHPHPKFEAAILAWFAVDENGVSKSEQWFGKCKTWTQWWIQQGLITAAKTGNRKATRYAAEKLIKVQAGRVLAQRLAGCRTVADQNFLRRNGADALRNLEIAAVQRGETDVAIGAGEVAAGGFGKFLLGLSDPALSATFVGEFIGAWGGKQFGKAVWGKNSYGELGGEEVGGLAGSMFMGAFLGWYVPVIGWITGATAGAVSYGIGAGVRFLGHRFNWW